MCEKTVTQTIYTCGDVVHSDVIFTASEDQTRKDHTVKIIHLASSKDRGKCGRQDCRNP